ncbi:MAG: transcriptional regulator [Verrucomicrobiota bacterium]
MVPAKTKFYLDGELGSAEMLMLEQWVQLADDLGIPRSVAQIYGLLFMSEQPLSAKDCVEFLKISRSSAGQGLKALKEFGAIRSALSLGERSGHYEIEPDLGVLIFGLLEGRILPALTSFFSKINSEELKLKEAAFITERLEKLRRWEGKLVASTKLLKEIR